MANEKVDTVGLGLSPGDQAILQAVETMFTNLTKWFLDPRVLDPKTIHENAHKMLNLLEMGVSRLQEFTVTNFCQDELKAKGLTLNEELGKIEIADDAEIPEEIRKMVEIFNERGIGARIAKMAGPVSNIPSSGKLNA